MKIKNPWITVQCQSHDLTPNRLPTFLQEQYGQLAEDLIVEAILKTYFSRRGLPLNAVRYLEVGANHPIQTSNTYLFHHKWQGRGVLVEANPQLVPALQRVRPTDQVLHKAVVPAGYPEKVSIHIATHAELSSVDVGHVHSFGNIGTVERALEVESETLDNLLEQYFPEGLHLLSIDIEGLDLEVIRGSKLPRRPVFIVTEPSRHYHNDAEQGFAQAMQAKGYLEIARTDYNLIFGDRSALTMRPGVADLGLWQSVRTFDIFDTLIARHCIWPEALFVELERRCEIAGLAQARFDAERRVEHAEYGLTDIYSEVAQALGLTSQQADELAALELQLELDNVLPIRDHLDRLNEDSVLLSDTYLTPDQIQALLKRAGLAQHLPIVQTSHGKRSGQVWEDFARQGLRCVHLGDNEHSDVHAAARFGAHATLTAVSHPTAVEKHLYDNGLPQLAQALRSARLMTASDGLPDWLLRLQTHFNLPVLAATAGILLLHLQADQQREVLFASRDGRYLQLIFDALRTAAGRSKPVSRYWYTSRLSRTGGDATYLEYCQDLFATLPIVVDLCGTGTSIRKLYASLALKAEQRPPVYFCEYIAEAQMEATMRNAYGLDDAAPLELSALLSTQSFVNNELLELLNATPEGMVRGVVRVAGRFVPVRDEFEFIDEAAELVRAQSRYVQDFTANLAKTAGPPVLDNMAVQGPQLLNALSFAADFVQADFETLVGRLLPAHRRSEATLLRELVNRAS